MSKLNGKIAVVTGGGSGIGLAIARRFVAEGASVVVTGRRQKELDEAITAIGGAIEGVQGDISSLKDIEKLRAHVEKKHGRVDIIVANAGTGGTLSPFGHVTEKQFDEIVDVNFKGTFFSVQTLLPLMPNGGAIMLLGSTAAYKGLPAFTVYSATKAAIRSFARTWSTDLRDRKIRVNALLPGHIITPMADAVIKTEDERRAYHAFIAAQAPLGRMGEAEEIAAAAVFLASDESSYITGIELAVDGGLTQI